MMSQLVEELPDPVMRTWPPVIARPTAYLCDIDGTVAQMMGRAPFEWHRVGDDRPNVPVIRVIRVIKQVYPVIFASGRMEQCRALTRTWLSANVCAHRPPPQQPAACFCHSVLWMRQDDDFRPDAVVKREMFSGSARYPSPISAQYDIAGVFDDRLKVIKMWRELGLTVFDVAGFEG